MNPRSKFAYFVVLLLNLYARLILPVSFFFYIIKDAFSFSILSLSTKISRTKKVYYQEALRTALFSLNQQNVSFQC